MPFWWMYWGPAGGGFWWLFPLIGLVAMVVIFFACFRLIGGRPGLGCMGGRRGAHPGGIADLRRELQDLRDEVRRLRDRN